MADTTDISLFDVPLKLVAVQDPGGRDQRLWEAAGVSETETAAVVSAIAVAAAQERPGLQLVTDQGRPYIASEAAQAYEAAELEHVPAPEGTPTAKATLERSFGTIKPLLAPIALLTAQLATVIPALRCASLARTVGQLLVAALLEAHRLGLSSRVRTTRPTDPDLLRVLAAEERDRVRHGNLSRRQILERLHEEYRMEGSREEFVRSLRFHAFEDIEQSERRFRRAILQQRPIQNSDRYFVAIVHNVFDEKQPQRDQARRVLKERHRQRENERRFRQEQQQLDDAPDWAVLKGLSHVANTYRPKINELLLNGMLGRVVLLRAMEAIVKRDGTQARDTLEVLWKSWAGPLASSDQLKTMAVRRLWDVLIRNVEMKNHDFTRSATRRILYAPASP